MAVFRSFGPPSVLQYETDFPKPSRRKGEVLVKVAAASVNPVDWKTRKGELPGFTVTRPKVSRKVMGSLPATVPASVALLEPLCSAG